MTIQKAILESLDGGGNIEFMFNPSQLAFEEIVETNESSGARTQSTGTAKVDFSHIKARKITINNILFDTYEDGGDVIANHIEKFKKAVQFIQKEERPPIYRFRWGEQVYLRRCFVEKLNYKLTMFLPNGTPVRAVIDSLTLKEADEPKPRGSVATPATTKTIRQQDSLANRSKASKGRASRGGARR